MTDTQTKPSMNGVIRLNLPHRGRKKFSFSDDENDFFEVDVVAVYDAWYEVEWQLRDAEGRLPNDKWDEHGQNRLNFVQAVVNDAYARQQKEAPTLSRGEAEAFIMAIQKEASVLRNFFSPKSEERSSPPADSLESADRFSQ